MKLTKTQANYLEAVEWLIDGPIGRGATTLILFALIRKALRHKKEMIYIIDHFPLSRVSWEINIRKNLIYMINTEFKDSKIKIYEAQMAIMAE